MNNKLSKSNFLSDLFVNLLLKYIEKSRVHEKRVYLYQFGRLKSLLSFGRRKEPYVFIQKNYNPTLAWDVWVELMNCESLNIKSVRWSVNQRDNERSVEPGDFFEPVNFFFADTDPRNIHLYMFLVDGSNITKSMKW